MGLQMYRFQPNKPAIGLVLLLVVAGCGQQPLTPQEKADELFADGQFDQAIELVDELLRDETSIERSDHAHLLTLKGRCYWEMSDQAYRLKKTDEQLQLLNQAHQTLTQSIEVADTAEARHVRSLVLEALGRKDEAIDDQLAWRDLDVDFRKAYLNERPENSYVDLLSDRSDSEDEANADTETNSSRTQPRPHDDPADEFSDPLAKQQTNTRSATDRSTVRQSDRDGGSGDDANKHRSCQAV